MSALVLFIKIFLVTTRQLLFFLCDFFSTVNYLRKAFLGKVIKLLCSVSHSHVMPLLALEQICQECSSGRKQKIGSFCILDFHLKFSSLALCLQLLPLMRIKLITSAGDQTLLEIKLTVTVNKTLFLCTLHYTNNCIKIMTNIICFVCGFCMWYGTFCSLKPLSGHFHGYHAAQSFTVALKIIALNSSPSNCQKLQTTISMRCYHNNRMLGSRPSHEEGKMHVLT